MLTETAGDGWPVAASRSKLNGTPDNKSGVPSVSC